MSSVLISREMLLAEQEAKENFAVVIRRKNEIAVEAGSIAIDLANRIGKGIGITRAYKYRGGNGYMQWNVTGLPRPESADSESLTSYVASSHKIKGPQGLRGYSIELTDDETAGISRQFELSVNNTAYHPNFGTPYIDFKLEDIIAFNNDPELLVKSYETAGLKQLDSASHILNLVNQASNSL